MRNNPLIMPILDLLKEQKANISEYELIRRLEENGMEFSKESSNELELFKKHFLVMNALYKLQNELIEDGYFLTISSLSIKLDKISQQSSSADLIDYTNKKLSEYYLDWNNYKNTSKQDVSNLLSEFWEKYFSVDKKTEALSVLGLGPDVTIVQVKQAYRRLAAKHHPDKGGEHKDFMEIREAYEVLRFCF
jgi:DnaJ-domain-containing protein 1